MQGEEAKAHTLNNSVLNCTLIPSFTELARASPSKGKTSERINLIVILMISMAEYARLNLNLLPMFHQIAPGWDVLEKVVEKNVTIRCTQCAKVLGMLLRRKYKD